VHTGYALGPHQCRQERGGPREQAYEIHSMADDLRINDVVDVPVFVASALRPEVIFDTG